MLTQHQLHWGVDQWAAYLSAQSLPCMPRSKLLLTALEEVSGDRLAVRELADIASGDTFLCMRLLRAAERQRTQRLAHETTTALAALMQLGSDAFRELLMTSPETDDAHPGLAACEARSHMAMHLALHWGRARADISPDEIALAAQLSEIGELLLWNFAPELPMAALEEMAFERATRSVQAQEQACGFVFRSLTLKCATIWRLPALLIQLIRGADNVRANMSRLCVDTARHLAAGADNPALPCDLVEAKRLMPHASLEWLASCLVGLGPEEMALVVERAQQKLQEQALVDDH
ncbi:HDOD domain-containing protein [Dechloromonas sp. A34]|uniref:HDOD domain-containing protein n=1 Tax=Dechloromonas sp. A34 TaxID=447588 RepID=UPI0022496D40|nr:HDOD domain-containing protein [Dechloromonas sp. A34]